MSPRLLVIAKAPVAGLAKTRLGAQVGMQHAAGLAAAALLDTLRTCTAAVGAQRCRLALEGDLAAAEDAGRLAVEIQGWTVFAQRGAGLAERLASAHESIAVEAPGPVLQIGMDTPQMTVDHLAAAIGGLATSDAVLGDAEDGGWWALGLNDPRGAELLHGVEMSMPTTGAATRRAFERAGLVVGRAPVLRDVDTAADAEAVAAICPEGSEFARLWAATAASPA